jgi:hypothetical protein
MKILKRLLYLICMGILFCVALPIGFVLVLPLYVLFGNRALPGSWLYDTADYLGQLVKEDE